MNVSTIFKQHIVGSQPGMQTVTEIAHAELTCIDAKDRPKHVRCIERIAMEMHRTVDEVAPLYAEVLEHMNMQARIRDYLPILVSKNVKNMLFRSRPY